MDNETRHITPSAEAWERKAYLGLAIAIAVTVIVGFGLNAGRYNFNPSVFPAHVHLHGLVFMSWVALYVVQCVVVVVGRVAWHRRLGVAGAALAVMMLGLGLYTTVLCLQRGAVPPFFSPALFLVIDGLGIIMFFVLVAAAILVRQRSDWHKRLMLGATILVTSPAIGRILPMPLLGPWPVGRFTLQ
ncbi:hypothetical protein [Asticcacaulis biprosthecium]|uniref:hypothetical protein n=1 Tax=Asticcacaulis biprosthecium TaxID=76891 RepID=UPI00068121BB|nr:hypothetical protein [Asticcacaulis biprosthecium]